VILANERNSNKKDFNEKKNKFVGGEESANVYCLLQLGILFNSGKSDVCVEINSNSYRRGFL